MIASWLSAVGLSLLAYGTVSETPEAGVVADNEASRAEKPLTLDEVLESVDERYPLVIAALREQDEARGARLSAQGAFDPLLTIDGDVEVSTDYPRRKLELSVEQPTPYWGTAFFGKYRYGEGKFPPYDGEFETDPGGELKAGLKIPLWRDGAIDRRRAALRQAELSVRIAELSANQQRLEARRAATVRYWEWVAAGARREVVVSWLDLARTRDSAIAARVAQGDVPEIEHVENQRTILQREAALAAAERDLNQTALELGLFLRGPSGEALTPDPRRLPRTLPEPSSKDLGDTREVEALALSRRPELGRIEAQRARSVVDLDLAENQKAPGIELRAAGSRGLGEDPESGLELSVFVDIPILNRVQSGRAAAAEGAVAKNEAQLRLAQDRVRAEVRTAQVNMETARTRAELTSREVVVAERLAKGELERFELGESNLLLVNLREQATTEAGLRYVDLLLDYHRSVAAFEAAIAEGISNATEAKAR